MTLVNCRDCAKKISVSAATCPQCGAPGPALPTLPENTNGSGIKIGNGEALGIICLAVLAVLGMGLYDRYKPSKDTAAVVTEVSTCGKNDLQCRGNNTLGSAAVYCRSHVERLATHAVRWTDKMLEPKFSRFRWRNPVAGEITYIGDKIEFQNGFGAYTPIIYECDLAADEKTVLDVRVQEGRLN
ncbi:zinc ribbon domain-containing protein [Massilia violaceinigra]|uniref:Zinc ribbon domain-containing protein n=1 Tax=Massilia violaceinigra TaxID=2045208 RepID=A0ABY4A454_9BURK|nr:zinc ribbon domain-containing protein [Massilia violaceinigra]UOD29427.1 zinc ribbon domain-containing protein [Massilia violaceinigra]